MIDADFSAENITVYDDGVRLIDFDNTGFGRHLFEQGLGLLPLFSWFAA
jgi:Ser/Thr protein kinase RdoA (MazF antagonist)